MYQNFPFQISAVADTDGLGMLSINIFPVKFLNEVHGHTSIPYTLELKHQHPYLGLIINEKMQWSPHINNLAIKASIKY